MKLGYAQARRELSLSVQIRALEVAGCHKIYAETIPVTIKGCPQRDHLFTQLREGDVLVVLKLSCFTLSLEHLVRLINMLHKKRVDLWSLQDPFDTTRFEDQLFFSIFAALEPFQHSYLREQTQRGLEAARAKGHFGGRPKGLAKKARNVARLAKQLYERREQSVQEMCRQLSISRSTFYNYLRFEDDEQPAQKEDET